MASGALRVTYPALMSKRIRKSAAIAGGDSEESIVKSALLDLDTFLLDAIAL